jgi:hypothetical protein
MLILPDRPKLLMPVPQQEWRDHSQAQWKDQFGNPGVQTRFRLTARLHDGFVKWRLWFDSRDDADEFLGSLARFILDRMPIPREDWHLPNEIWGDPELYPELRYDFATVTFLTITGSNQTFTSPSDWDNSDNTIEAVGGGASGATERPSNGHAPGGGGGAYAKITNFSFASPGSTTATYSAGSGGAAIVSNSTGSNGNSGTSSYFNDTADPGGGATNAKCSAQFGAGATWGSGSRNGGTGGASASSWGQTTFSGGRGGNLTGASGTGASGGGGAAGPAGVGGSGGNNGTTSLNVSTTGGSANNGATAGGAAGGAGNGGDGSAGTEWDLSHGCSSGGGGGAVGGSVMGGSAPSYGGGGGGAGCGSATATSGAGGQGLIVITYNPLPIIASAAFFQMF